MCRAGARACRLAPDATAVKARTGLPGPLEVSPKGGPGNEKFDRFGLDARVPLALPHSVKSLCGLLQVGGQAFVEDIRRDARQGGTVRERGNPASELCLPQGTLLAKGSPSSGGREGAPWSSAANLFLHERGKSWQSHINLLKFNTKNSNILFLIFC